MLKIGKEVAAMQRLTVDQLRARYAEVFGERTNARNKAWLIKRIAWRLQANAEGDLSARARRRAMDLANDSDLRVTAPREAKRDQSAVLTGSRRESRLPSPGTTLVRQYKGETIQVQVLDDGFEFEGERYRSLSAVATKVTDSHWSGHRFFGLQQGRGK